MHRNLQLITKRVFLNKLTYTPRLKPSCYPTRLLQQQQHSFLSTTVINKQSNTFSEKEKLHKVCWKCNHIASRAAVSCENTECGVIQPTVPELNFYELLSVGTGENKSSPTFDVELGPLKRQFLKLQQVAHPDSYSNATEREHKYAEIQSSLLNKAYHTLKDPLARAQYLLAQKGVEIDESESLHNPTLLMEVMEVREELEEAITDNDVEAIKNENDEKIKETVANLSRAFADNDLDLAKDYSIQLQYWENIRRAIIDWAPGHRVEIKH
ncbi:Co-chaperone HscB, C-terminal oligomerization domain-containing protein [Cunninghamella echinulata]|nr:Co-chaperone HscB, C-terminal oligomerization domain-containing protein [Cunninghamella echinulata]